MVHPTATRGRLIRQYAKARPVFAAQPTITHKEYPEDLPMQKKLKPHLWDIPNQGDPCQIEPALVLLTNGSHPFYVLQTQAIVDKLLYRLECHDHNKKYSPRWEGISLQATSKVLFCLHHYLLANGEDFPEEG